MKGKLGAPRQAYINCCGAAAATAALLHCVLQRFSLAARLSYQRCTCLRQPSTTYTVSSTTSTAAAAAPCTEHTDAFA
jgi:hypothetical protein